MYKCPLAAVYVELYKTQGTRVLFVLWRKKNVLSFQRSINVAKKSINSYSKLISIHSKIRSRGVEPI